MAKNIIYSGTKKETTCIRVVEKETIKDLTIKEKFPNLKNLRFLCYNAGNLETANIEIDAPIENLNESFIYCRKMKKLTLKIDMSNVKYIQHMFGECELLEDLDIIWNTSNVINANGLFSGCRSLKRIDTHKIDTSNMISMEDMFSNTGLTVLDLSNFNTSKVKNMASMFFHYRYTGYNETLKQANDVSLKFIDVSSFDTSNVEDMGTAFAGNDKLKHLDLSSFHTPKLKYCVGLLICCTSLEDVDMSNFDLRNIVFIHDVFNRCDNLSKITIGRYGAPLFYRGMKENESLYSKVWKNTNNGVCSLPKDFEYLSEDDLVGTWVVNE